MGVRRCLARSLTSLEPLRTPKSSNGPRSNSFRPDSPLTTTSNRGRKTHPAPNTDPSIMVELLLYEPVLLIGAKSHPALENYDITHVDIEHPIFINVSWVPRSMISPSSSRRISLQNRVDASRWEIKIVLVPSSVFW